VEQQQQCQQQNSGGRSPAGPHQLHQRRCQQ
jgi:hypothetical protein